MDSPIFFEISEVLEFAKEKNEEMIPGARDKKAGPLNGKLSNFVSRLENKINDKRLDFLLGEKSKKITFEDTLKQLIGYSEKQWVQIVLRVICNFRTSDSTEI